jgi:hypothetical protein
MRLETQIQIVGTRAHGTIGGRRRAWSLAGLLVGCCFCTHAAAQVPAGEASGALGAVLPRENVSRYDRVIFVNEFNTHFYLSGDPKFTHSFAFFPPVPPPLDTEIPILAPFDAGPAAPPELSAFVGDIYYPFLAARLASSEVSKALRVRIAAHHDAKLALATEIKSRLLALKGTGGQYRAAQLAALAAAQATRIADLEAVSEGIRADLGQMRALGIPVETSDLKETSGWRTHGSGVPTANSDEMRQKSQALRGLAYYLDGLSPSQRYILLEGAVRLRFSSAPADPGYRWLNFSPEPARIRISVNLPKPLEAKIEKYVAMKESLRGEIGETLRNTEDSTSETRRNGLLALGEAQASRFAELESLAEDIRLELSVPIALAGPPSAPPMPVELGDRITAYRQHKVELLKKLRAMLAAPTPTISSEQAQPAPKAVDPSAGALAWLHDGSHRTEVQPTALRVSVAEFDRAQGELIDSLNKEESGIREALAAYIRTTNGPADRKSINDLLRDFEDARQKQEVWNKYADYRTAVLMPGLSAGQRRILFDAAVEQLSLPLPAGEKID